MRILQVVERFYPRAGGVEFHAFHISRELAKLGHDVTVVTSNSVAQQDVPGISNKGLTLRNSLPDLPVFEADEEGVKIYRFRPSLALYTLYLTPGLIRYLFKHLREYDIVHVHQYLHAEPSLVAIASKLRKTPFVLTAHDLISSYGGFRELAKNFADGIFGRVVLRSAAALIALTPINAEQYVQLGAPRERIRIIPNGITPEEFANLTTSAKLLRDLANPQHLVLFVGRVVSYKGPQYLVHAIADILDEYPSTKFVFIGQDDGYGAELKRQAVSERVLNQCAFMGQVSDEKLKEFYATADVFVLPSSCEAFGIAALESIAAGTPVVLADLGGLSYILSEIGGHPIDMQADVSAQIARAVKAVFKNDTDQQIDSQRQHVLNAFSWKSIAEQLVSVYEEVLAQGG
ncbi:MAG TPA: glycosyltransferase family 4 protein [Candidatus Acidoferrales bacterium]|nr:glycosyltransferase family 4 protein [Candidatus Acidoferrales bacterium]